MFLTFKCGSILFELSPLSFVDRIDLDVQQSLLHAYLSAHALQMLAAFLDWLKVCLLLAVAVDLLYVCQYHVTTSVSELALCKSVPVQDVR